MDTVDGFLIGRLLKREAEGGLNFQMPVLIYHRNELMNHATLFSLFLLNANSKKGRPINFKCPRKGSCSDSDLFQQIDFPSNGLRIMEYTLHGL